ncbi:unnamed protein product [Clonostachys rosea f. rosea IK726]|uniref:Uncharacterized protein n=1 Tax=Clonostachys rosea f. rosea IK726 TaxID=1349383 RepID=A0ACA9U3Y5_BIOOC|nr:unnamed protein product [Clonostachys rosea f. rosea IK726]
MAMLSIQSKSTLLFITTSASGVFVGFLELDSSVIKFDSGHNLSVLLLIPFLKTTQELRYPDANSVVLSELGSRAITQSADESTIPK